MLKLFRKHVFSDLRPYVCIYEGCTATEKFFGLRGEWIAHQNSHKSLDTGIASSAEICPLCLKDFTSAPKRFYSHLSHHMEDVRLFALPPSQRQFDDSEAFYNSSDTEASQETLSIRRGELSVIMEESPTEKTLVNSLKQRLRACRSFDKGMLIGDWLSEEKV